MTEYQTSIVFYFGMQIENIFLKNEVLYLDNFFEMIMVELLNDYKKYDNANKSLLDSINDYIYNNKEKIEKLIEKYDIINK